MSYELINADCLESMRQMEECSISACVTDPPYFLHFMGRDWDHAPSPVEQQRQHQAWAREVMRILRPGGHLLAMGGERTYHRLVCGIEDAGFDIRTTITWHHGQGFPKSLNVSRELLSLPWCSCGGGDVAGSGTIPPIPPDKSDAALGADATVAPGSSVFHRDGIPGVDASTPFQGIGASNGAAFVFGPSNDLAADHATRLRPETGVLPPERNAAVDCAVKQVVGHFGPVVFGPSRMTPIAESNEVAQSVRSVQIEPESLRDQVVNNEVVGSAAVGALAVPLDDGSGNICPAPTFVAPPATSPGGISSGTEAHFIVFSHTDSGAVNGFRVPGREMPSEFVAAESACESRRPALKNSAASALEDDGLVCPNASPGAEFTASESGLKTDTALLAGFGKHTDIIRQGITKNQISVCAKCHRPVRAEWVIEGLGTALKPSTEFICMARKPLEESSIARQVLKTGTGAINIDGCRVGSGGQLQWAQPRDMGYHGGTDNGKVEATKASSGRFPANLLLSHHESCQRIGTKRVRGGTVVSHSKQSTINTYGEYKTRSDAMGYTDPDGMEEVESWECARDADGQFICPVALLDLQSGTLKSGKLEPYEYNNSSSIYGNGGGIKYSSGRITGSHPASQGGASRFFLNLPPEDTELHEIDTGPGFFKCMICDTMAVKHGTMSETLTGDEPCANANIAETNSSPSTKQDASAQSSAQGQIPLGSAVRGQSESKSVRNAESDFGNTPATIKSTAQFNAWDLQIENLVHRVRCAENLCDACAIAFAHELAELPHSQEWGARLGRLSIGLHKKQILRQSLALFAESWGATATTLTTQSLQLLFGYVAHAINESIISEQLEVSDSDPTLSIYHPTSNSIDVGWGGFYSAKASSSERNDFTKSLPRTKNKRKRYQQDLSKRWCARVKNQHPTIKPLGLCDWLVKLVCPPDGVVLDPFMGSGSIGCSAVRQGFHFIGIDQEAEYVTIAKRRLKHHAAEIEKVKAERLFA